MASARFHTIIDVYKRQVMDGVKAKNFTGCLRARLGNLDGISDDWFRLTTSRTATAFTATTPTCAGLSFW